MLPSLAEYQQLIYSLPGTYPVIRHSTLVVVQHGPAFAEVTGDIEFDHGIILSVWEDLNFARNVIQGYSYLVARGEEQLYWYDPQPHPNDPSLASTHPHINTFSQTLSIIESLHQESVLTNRTCPT